MLISLAIFLCPTSYGSASRHYYSAIASVVDIPKYDWCSILDCLVDGIAKFKNSTVKANTVGKDRTSSLCGCFFVLVAPHIVLREDFPRIKIWDDCMIQEYLALEGNSGDGTSFGLLELKEPSETPFVVVSVSSSSFGRLPAKVESFIQNLPPHNDQSNVRSQIRDMCSKFHREIMTASLAAIQPVVSRQLCSMAEYMWNGLQNHGAPGTSAATMTSIQMDREMHTEVVEGMTTRSGRRNKKTEVDAVTSCKSHSFWHSQRN